MCKAQRSNTASGAKKMRRSWAEEVLANLFQGFVATNPRPRSWTDELSGRRKWKFAGVLPSTPKGKGTRKTRGGPTGDKCVDGRGCEVQPPQGPWRRLPNKLAGALPLEKGTQISPNAATVVQCGAGSSTLPNAGQTGDCDTWRAPVACGPASKRGP